MSFQNVFLEKPKSQTEQSVTYYLNEQIQDVFTTHFFENKHDHR